MQNCANLVDLERFLLQNENLIVNLLARIGFDTAENERSKIWGNFHAWRGCRPRRAAPSGGRTWGTEAGEARPKHRRRYPGARSRSFDDFGIFFWQAYGNQKDEEELSAIFLSSHLNFGDFLQL